MGKNYVPGEYERILKALPGYLRLFASTFIPLLC